MDFAQVFGIFVSFSLINNFVLNKFLGICPFIGVSKNIESAIGMGFAVTFVMGLASFVTALLYKWFLIPLQAQYLKIVLFILVIASLVQLVEMVIQKFSPPLYKALGIYLPLITTNCAVMGIALINLDESYFIQNGVLQPGGELVSLVAGLAGGIGFLISLLLMSSIREKLELNGVPKAFKDVPIAFITGGLMAMGFMVFDRAMISGLMN